MGDPKAVSDVTPLVRAVRSDEARVAAWGGDADDEGPVWVVSR